MLSITVLDEPCGLVKYIYLSYFIVCMTLINVYFVSFMC